MGLPSTRAAPEGQQPRAHPDPQFGRVCLAGRLEQQRRDRSRQGQRGAHGSVRGQFGQLAACPDEQRAVRRGAQRGRRSTRQRRRVRQGPAARRAAGPGGVTVQEAAVRGGPDQRAAADECGDVLPRQGRVGHGVRAAVRVPAVQAGRRADPQAAAGVRVGQQHLDPPAGPGGGGQQGPHAGRADLAQVQQVHAGVASDQQFVRRAGADGQGAQAVGREAIALLVAADPHAVVAGQSTGPREPEPPQVIARQRVNLRAGQAVAAAEASDGQVVRQVAHGRSGGQGRRASCSISDRRDRQRLYFLAYAPCRYVSLNRPVRLVPVKAAFRPRSYSLSMK